MKKLWIFLLFFSCCHKTVAPTPFAGYPVKVGKVKIQDTPIFLEALGHVDSINAVQIRSRIEGEITGVYFQQGDDVKKGDLLFTIDPRPYQAKLKQAEANLEQNLANLSLASEKVKRYRTLTKDEYYSQIDYETLQANFASNAALVEQSRAELDSALINLNYCWIYAPIDGMMGILKVDLGNLVGDDGSTLTTLNQMNPIYVTFSIPEFLLPKIQKRWKKEEPLKVLSAYENFEQEIFEGTLFMLDNTVDPNTGMITLRALFENQSKQLWPGQFVRTRLILYIEPNAIVIPYTAIQLTQTGPVIFVLKSNQTVELRPVTIGQRDADQVVILSGLHPEETIVVEGQLNLFEGAKVRVL